LPVRYPLLYGEAIPLTFWAALVVFVLYTLTYFATLPLLTQKRLLSALFGFFIGASAFYSLYSDSAYADCTFEGAHATTSSRIAFGFIFGTYTGDLFWITKTQLQIPPLLLHHVSDRLIHSNLYL
jgi:hypothetical protein